MYGRFVWQAWGIVAVRARHWIEAGVLRGRRGTPDARVRLGGRWAVDSLGRCGEACVSRGRCGEWWDIVVGSNGSIKIDRLFFVNNLCFLFFFFVFFLKKNKKPKNNKNTLYLIEVMLKRMHF